MCVCACVRERVYVYCTHEAFERVCVPSVPVCVYAWCVCVCVCMCASVSAADTVGVEASCLLMMAPLISWPLGLF